MNKKEYIIKIICAVVIIMLGGFAIFMAIKEDGSKNDPKVSPTPTMDVEPIKVSDFTYDIIKLVNEEKNSNYLISPYNIEIALNMLRDGAEDNTKNEFDKAIGNRTINDVSVKDKINIANVVFIKNNYKNDIKSDYTKVLTNKYDAEILYDEYKEPTVINNWVKEKTNGMIDKLLNKIDDNFILGVASALAIDVKWEQEFECIDTRSEEFTKIDNSKMNTEMMHQTYEYGADYFKTNDAEGIILPYQKEENSDIELEFIGILPNNSVNDYVKSLNKNKITDILNNKTKANSKLHIDLSLPRFSYDYELDNFTHVLNRLGIIDAFNPSKANFKKMMDSSNTNLYVGQAIHKTKIELNESGTKAAAVTFFGVEGAMIQEPDYEIKKILFNKPFVYIIREKNAGEILFFGTVFEPNKWEGSTCKN